MLGKSIGVRPTHESNPRGMYGSKGFVVRQLIIVHSAQRAVHPLWRPGPRLWAGKPARSRAATCGGIVACARRLEPGTVLYCWGVTA